jgi:hypothetical protein
VALQAATAERLSAQFRRALHDQATIGRRIATRLRAANLRLRLTTEQSATAIQILLARLAPDAITATELAPVAASAQSPSPVDLLNASHIPETPQHHVLDAGEILEFGLRDPRRPGR